MIHEHDDDFQQWSQRISWDQFHLLSGADFFLSFVHHPQDIGRYIRWRCWMLSILKIPYSDITAWHAKLLTWASQRRNRSSWKHILEKTTEQRKRSWQTAFYFFEIEFIIELIITIADRTESGLHRILQNIRMEVNNPFQLCFLITLNSFLFCKYINSSTSLCYRVFRATGRILTKEGLSNVNLTPTSTFCPDMSMMSKGISYFWAIQRV